MSDYLYRDKAGREIGPFDPGALIKLRAAGVLNDETSVRSMDSKDWQPLQTFIPAWQTIPAVTPASADTTPSKSSTAQHKWTFVALGALVVAFFIYSHQPGSTSNSQSSNRAPVSENDSKLEKALREVQRISESDRQQKWSAEKASAGCVDNLKQIGLSFRLFSNDHDDQFPFLTKAIDGGTLEFCSRGSDGFERNAVTHFQSLSNELVTPRVLVCPADFSKQRATDFLHRLSSDNVSYRIRSGTNVNESNPSELLALCPIHGHAVYCDGSVRRGKGR